VKRPDWVPGGAWMGGVLMGDICLRCGALVPPAEWDGQTGREIHDGHHRWLEALLVTEASLKAQLVRADEMRRGMRGEAT
jgi:hypothetical protein